MNYFEAYLSLLNDSILNSLIFVPGKAYVGDVMLILGEYNSYLILIVSLIGSVIGCSLNWGIGKIFRKIKFFNPNDQILERMESFFAHKGKWILLLSFIPLWGNLFTTAAGVTRFNFGLFLILVSFSKFIGYCLAIFF